MTAFIDVFERHEKKYRIDLSQYEKLMSILHQHMHADDYGSTRICSLYFDTPDDYLIERSLEQPLYKEKFRVRSYDIPTETDTVFIEIKKKFKGVVYKRRIACTLAAAREFIYGVPFVEAYSHYPLVVSEAREEALFPTSLQIAREIEYLKNHYFMLEPAMFISSLREAYLCNDESGLRITFDSDVRWRDTKVDYAFGLGGESLIGRDERIMEIKCQGPMPLWLVHELSQLHISPVSFSKYGESYKAARADKRAMQDKGNAGIVDQQGQEDPMRVYV
jgi:hypothetical protein